MSWSEKLIWEINTLKREQFYTDVIETLSVRRQ